MNPADAPRPRPPVMGPTGPIRCPKCASTATGVLHQTAWPASAAGPGIPEHMRRWCHTCRYAWVTYVPDASTAPTLPLPLPPPPPAFVAGSTN